MVAKTSITPSSSCCCATHGAIAPSNSPWSRSSTGSKMA